MFAPNGGTGRRMRYALARGVVGLAPASVQRDRLQSMGFDLLLQEDSPTRESQKALTHLLARLRAGDEVSLCSLEVLQLPTADVVLLLQRFQAAGMKLLLVDTLDAEDLTHSPSPRLLELLSRHEMSWASRSTCRISTALAASAPCAARFSVERRARSNMSRVIATASSAS